MARGSILRANSLRLARAAWIAVLLSSLLAVLAALPVHADTGSDTDTKPQCDNGETDRNGQCRGSGGEEGGEPGERPQVPRAGDESTEERLESPCSTLPPGENPGGDCTRMTTTCPEGMYLYAVWRRDFVYDGSEWVVVSVPEWYEADPAEQCRPAPEDPLDNETVRIAVEEFGLPAARLQMYPVGAKTLVQLDSIFYSDTPVAEFPLDIGGTEVDIRATPTKFHWDFGNAERTTPHGGEPWSEGGDPDQYVIHVYEEAGTYSARVDVEYTVEWNAGDGWSTIPEPILGQPGPDVEIDALEASGVGVGN